MTTPSPSTQLASLFDHGSIQACMKRASAVRLPCVYRAYRHSRCTTNAQLMHGHPTAKLNGGQTIVEQI